MWYSGTVTTSTVPTAKANNVSSVSRKRSLTMFDSRWSLIQTGSFPFSASEISVVVSLQVEVKTVLRTDGLRVR